MFQSLRYLALLAGFTAFMGAAAAPGHAVTKSKVVIELFTSQGCSSCPPADKLVGELAERRDVIALTFPVDYWDYLGWKDTLASPAYSMRQRAYARARGDGQVYTPQIVVDGKAHVVGSHVSAVKNAILKSANQDTAGVSLTMHSEGDSIIIKASAAPIGMRVKPATIWLALVKKSATVKIERGENRGSTIIYHQVVKLMSPVGQWTGEKVTIKLPKNHLQSTDSDGCTVLLQQDHAGPIIAAAEMKNW
jgi:hypothetical protein